MSQRSNSSEPPPPYSETDYRYMTVVENGLTLIHLLPRYSEIDLRLEPHRNEDEAYELVDTSYPEIPQISAELLLTNNHVHFSH